MTIHFGDVSADRVLYIPFASYGANGESITLTGLAVTDVEIFKNGGTTQRAGSDSGIALLDTDGIDFDGITGIHGFSIDLQDDTDAGFYSVGDFYWVIVSAVTINTQTVNFIAATFRIVAMEGVTGYPKVDVGALGGDAQSMTDLKDFADAGYDPSTNKVNGVVLVDTTTTNTDMRGTDNAATAAALAVVDDFLDTEIAAILAAVDTEVASILAAVDTEVGTIITNLATAQADLDLLTGADGATLATLQANYAPLKPTTAGRTLDVTVGGNAGVDWANVEAPTTVLNLSGTTIKTATDVETDTNELQADWANGGRLDLILDARASQTSVDTIDDFLDTEIAAILVAVDTEIAAILVDTGTDIPATLSGLLTTAMTEGYRATGATGSVRDLLYELLADIAEFSISGTTKTLKKLDGSTTAKTKTLNDATSPTSITETT